jgi:putative acetyltransferase
MVDNMTLRREHAEDHGAIRAVNEAAFGRPDEADLVDQLRKEGAVLASFVAESDSEIVGHILFSRMLIDTESGLVPAAALAPLAVVPGHQRLGVGGRLVRHGLDWLRGREEQVVIVLGHPEYYPRFGFSSDRARALKSPFPAEALMALELTPGALDRVRGRVRYANAFGL